MNKEFKIKIYKDADLKNFCTFKIGGKAKYVFVAENTYSLVKICKLLKQQNIKFKVIGLGANLLFSDSGFDGGIIVNRADNIKIFNNSVCADSGANVGSLIKKCIVKNLGGLENLFGIPSTVGGAVVNSLGAFGTNLTDYVDYVECFNPETNKIFKLSQEQCNFAYRSSIFKENNLIILRVKLKLKKEDWHILEQNMLASAQKKKLSQPLNFPSAGSVFKHKNNIIPARVIDELGLKGLRIGGAEISTKHAGFIVNVDSATAEDVKKLINIVKNRVFKETGEILEPEIEFVE